MAGNRPEERVRQPVLHQSWRAVTFLHWRADPAVVAARLPAGLEPDLVDGSAWLGLTAFRVEGLRPHGVPPVPFLSSFPETNLRTYVRDGRGRDGLWFLSLDVTSALNVAGGRAAGVPYYLSAMSVRGGDTVRYRCRRLVGPAAHHDIAVRPGPPIDPAEVTAVESALVGRWRAFSRRAGRLLEFPVEHQPWPLRRAEVREIDESVFRAAGLARPAGGPLAHYSEGVDSRFGPPRLAARPVTGV